MKRFLSLFLSLTLLATGLCACTPGGQGTDTTAEDINAVVGNFHRLDSRGKEQTSVLDEIQA